MFAHRLHGQTGPWKQRAGHDLNYMAVAGMSSYTGRTGEAAGHEQLRARGMVVEAALEDGTRVRQIGDPIVFSPCSEKCAIKIAPVSGQHTREALLGAGFSAHQVDEWHRAGIVFDALAD